MKQQFYKYVSRNVAGMLGISLYILADTFFISLHSGADGITMLNLALPLYGLIYAIGSMIGIGTATKHAILKAQGKKNIDYYFTQSIFWQVIFSIPFMIIGIFAPEELMRFMGGDATIAAIGKDYARIFMIGAPFFMINFTFSAFARNDNAPTIAMVASLIASGFNIVFDYVFMFPMNMGLAGAALATAMSPIVSILICCSHYRSDRCTLEIMWKKPSIVKLFENCKLGVSAFVGEISSAITTVVFNVLILKMAGNTGVAAYGVIANYALIVISVFNGISQGMQPLFSKYYGEGKDRDVKQLLRLGLFTSLVVEALVIGIFWMFTDGLVSMFNSEGNILLAEYAKPGMRMYFLGYIFAGINIVLVTFFSATNKAWQASVSSLFRGMIGIVVCAIIMANIWGLNGVWLSFFSSELIAFILILVMYNNSRLVKRN